MQKLSEKFSGIPADNAQRQLKVARPNEDESLPHIGLVGDTYTLLLTGEDTNGRFCLIDMHVPPGGGPPPHRHDFEETFILQEGEVEFTFRGKKSVLRAGQMANVPANAPHQFQNASAQAARMLCLCSPAGQEDFFRQVGIAVAGRTTPPPKPKPEEMRALGAKVAELAPKYRTELLEKA